MPGTADAMIAPAALCCVSLHAATPRAVSAANGSGADFLALAMAGAPDSAGAVPGTGNIVPHLPPGSAAATAPIVLTQAGDGLGAVIAPAIGVTIPVETFAPVTGAATIDAEPAAGAAIRRGGGRPRTISASVTPVLRRDEGPVAAEDPGRAPPPPPDGDAAARPPLVDEDRPGTGDRDRPDAAASPTAAPSTPLPLPPATPIAAPRDASATAMPDAPNTPPAPAGEIAPSTRVVSGRAAGPVARAVANADAPSPDGTIPIEASTSTRVDPEPASASTRGVSLLPRDGVLPLPDRTRPSGEIAAARRDTMRATLDAPISMPAAMMNTTPAKPADAQGHDPVTNPTAISPFAGLAEDGSAKIASAGPVASAAAPLRPPLPIPATPRHVDRPLPCASSADGMPAATAAPGARAAAMVPATLPRVTTIAGAAVASPAPGSAPAAMVVPISALPGIATPADPASPSATAPAARGAFAPIAPVAVDAVVGDRPMPNTASASTPLPAFRAFAAALFEASRDHDPREAPALAALAAPAAGPVIAAADGASPTPLDLGQPRWPLAMIERIERLRDDADAGDTRIRLVPDALGAIDVSLRREGEAVHVRFHAEQAETRRLLAEAQPQLAHAAEARGLRLGETSVTGGRAEAHAAGSPVQSGGGDAHGGGERPRHPPAPAIPPAPDRIATTLAAEADASGRIA